MSNYRDIFKSPALRAIIGVALLVGGVVWLGVAAGGGGGIGAAFANTLFACATMVLAGVILAGPLAALFAEPAGGLFYPGRTFSRPQPIYSIPQAKRAEGLYEEAIADLERIAEAYPAEVRPYLEMIAIVIDDLEDSQRAEEIYKRGLSRLKKAKDRAILEETYETLRTHLGE